ncbi:MAG: TIM barrel protein [Lachnospiraceae bacterium]|nr:TIM barrel protein [Lachnospiraceae bacterium]
MQDKTIYVDTCVYGTGKMEKVPEYATTFGKRIGFEILAMFDLPDFEEKLKAQLPVFSQHKAAFHGPVFCVEHSAKRGTPAYEETMWHVRKTRDYARELHSRHFVMHLNNCEVAAGKKEEMLKNALENYQELTEMFGAFDCPVYVENTGTILQKNMLLDQGEFTDLCRSEGFEVLIDLGHAHANGWDIYRLIDDLAPQIRAYHLHNNDGSRDLHNRLHEGTMDFDRVFAHILEKTPEADLVIEYTRQTQEGEGLYEDIRELIAYFPEDDNVKPE